MLRNIAVRGNTLRRVCNSSLQTKTVSRGFQLHNASRLFSVSSKSGLQQFTQKTVLIPQKSSFFLTSNRMFASGAEKTIVVPTMGDSISDGTVQKWHKAVGDYVNQDELVVSIETDKIVVEIRAPENGVVKKTLAGEGDKVLVGADLYVLETGVAAPKAAEAPAAAAAPKEEKVKTKEEAKVEPAKEAPKSAAPPPPPKPQQSTQQQQPAKSSTPTPSPVVAGAPRAETRVKMTRMRERIAGRLKDSQNTYALLTTFNKIDMTNIMELRNQYKDEFQTKHGVKLGFMSAFVKAATVALTEQPIVNAVIDGSEIVYRNFVDVSVAVATPTGLVVPVIRDADKMSFAQIEKTIGLLGKKARDQQLAIEDMSGGTFTISNGGVYGSLMGTPIVNPPQSAILGMHAVNKEAVVVNDQIVIRPIMYVALTYDHRLIDGKEAVTFLKKIKETIEDPRRVLLDL